jgi:uncharacterized protein YciW
VQQRVTLTHEIGHLRFGEPCVSFCGNNERDVIEWTARTLLPDLPTLGQLLRRADVATVAAKLHVTLDVVNDRIVTLTDAERVELAGIVGSDDSPPDVLAAHGHPRRSPRPAHICKARGAGRQNYPARTDTDTRPLEALPAGSAN